MNKCTFPYPAMQLVILLVLLDLGVAVESSGQDKELAERAISIGQRESERFTIQLDRSKVEAQPQLLQNWTNPTSGSFGSLHAWISDHRPVAISSLYMFADKPGEINAEFQSLSGKALSAKRDETIIWHPKSPGVKFTLLPKLTPAETRPQQSRQMRQIARRFSVISRSYKDQSPQQLRLLPTPLIDYGDDEQFLFGGVFTFAIGTDPAALLLIETVKKDDQLHWQFALARMCIDQLEVRLDGHTIWTAAEHKHPFDRVSEPYSIKQHIPVR